MSTDARRTYTRNSKRRVVFVTAQVLLFSFIVSSIAGTVLFSAIEHRLSSYQVNINFNREALKRVETKLDVEIEREGAQ